MVKFFLGFPESELEGEEVGKRNWIKVFLANKAFVNVSIIKNQTANSICEEVGRQTDLIYFRDH